MEGITNDTVDKEQQVQNSKNLNYDPLENSGNILFGNSSDPDLHLYNTNIQNLNTPLFLSNLNFSFNIICFSETFLNDSNIDN